MAIRFLITVTVLLQACMVKKQLGTLYAIKIKIMKKLIVSALLACVALAAFTNRKTISHIVAHRGQITVNKIDNAAPGSPDTVCWKTTDGKVIKLQGGNLLKVGNVFHWFGHDFTGGTNFKAINHYTSTDLMNWTDAGPAFSAQTYTPAVPLAAGSTAQFPFDGHFLGRPFVMPRKESAGGGFVMMISFNNGAHPEARNIYSFLSAKTINGPWTYLESRNKYQLPDKNGKMCTMGDLGGYYDDSNNTGYLVYTYDDGVRTGANFHNGIRKLTDDLLDVTNDLSEFDKVGTQTTYGGGGREAGSIFKKDGYYYQTTSGTSGWAGSVTWYRTSKALPGAGKPQWSDFKSIPADPESRDSYNTQHDQIFQVPGTNLYVYIGDRWPGRRGPGSATIWERNAFFPLTFSGSVPQTPQLNAKDYTTNGGDWKINNIATGGWAWVK